MVVGEDQGPHFTGSGHAGVRGYVAEDLKYGTDLPKINNLAEYLSCQRMLGKFCLTSI